MFKKFNIYLALVFSTLMANGQENLCNSFFSQYKASISEGADYDAMLALEKYTMCSRSSEYLQELFALYFNNNLVDRFVPFAVLTDLERDEAVSLKGYCYEQFNVIDSAHAIYLRLASSYECPLYTYQLARYYGSIKDYENCISISDKTLKQLDKKRFRSWRSTIVPVGAISAPYQEVTLSAAIYALLGYSYDELIDYDNAAKNYKRALVFEPDYEVVQHNLNTLLISQ